MKKLSIALTMLPFLAAGPVLAQGSQDPDLLNPREQVLDRHPELNPDWTWMTKGQATQILRAEGYDFVLSLENSGAAWRGKAARSNEAYHVAVNRYVEAFGHLDKKGFALRELQATEPRTEKALKTLLATLNGPIAPPMSQMAPTGLTPGRPVATVMGEVGWSWMSDAQVHKILRHKGYTNVSDVTKDAQGIWRAKAIKDDLALHIGIDVYGNVETQRENQGGLAQSSPSD